MAKSTPSKKPPEGGNVSYTTEAISEQAEPAPLTEAEMAIMATAVSEATPSLMPPAAQAEEDALATWLSDKRITVRWGINQNRNSWVHVAGIGWKKLANNSDSAVVALSMLSAHARQLNSPVNYREEADGMIREMYVW